MLFLMLNQQYQSTKGNGGSTENWLAVNAIY